MGKWDMVARLLLAVLLSGLVGLERETSQKSAGLRTHTLVGMGAALFAVISITAFDAPDKSRIAAQIVTGIGFLGAGAIFREGSIVKGMTTAAGLWAVAAIGTAVGAGELFLGTTAALIVLGVLLGFRVFDAAVARRVTRVPEQVEVVLASVDRLSAVTKFVSRIDPAAEQISFKRMADGTATLRFGVAADRAEMVAEMTASVAGVASTEVLSPLLWTHKRPPGGAGGRS